MDDGFKPIYTQAVRLAESVGSEETMPRITQRQQHRHNVPSETVQDYYRMNVVIPFLDHVVTNLDDQFSGKCLLLLCHFHVIVEKVVKAM